MDNQSNNQFNQGNSTPQFQGPNFDLNKTQEEKPLNQSSYNQTQYRAEQNDNESKINWWQISTVIVILAVLIFVGLYFWGFVIESEKQENLEAGLEVEI